MNRGARSQVDLKRMRTVVEVARTESITTAAHTLGLTQSAVSRTVAELEQALGQRLFERTSRGIQITDAGQRLVARAKRLLTDVDDLIADIAAAPHHVTGRLRLGLGITGHHVSGAIAAFAGRHPEISMETTHASEQTLCPRLLHGELDLVIGSSSYLERWRELEVTKLMRLRQACAVRQGHPLTELAAPAEAEILSYPIILPQSVEPSHSDIARRYSELGLPPLKPQYVTNSFELMLMLIKATDAFLLMMHPDDDFGGMAHCCALLRDAVRIPAHFVSVARASQRPSTQVVGLFEQALRAQFVAAQAPAAG
jgi:DNA-binding transcriptional LysR family regulator